jgi:hypothetical protein
MQPLPIRTRRIYLGFLVLVFIAVLPIIILYASGYNFTKGFSIVETGGIYIGLSGSGAIVYINDAEVGRSTLLDRSFYKQNLKAGIYSVRVTRDGYYPWQKVLSVEPSYVTDADAVFIPQDIVKVALVSEALKPKTATDTPDTDYLSKSDLSNIAKAFAATSTDDISLSSAATITPIAVSKNIGLFIVSNTLFERFLGATSTAASNFCTVPTRCVSTITIASGNALHADFLFGDSSLVVYTTLSGVYLAEADIRTPDLLVPLYQSRGADFRIIGNQLIIKDGKQYYRLDGF